jgi:AcrR family transcriptional regulator
MNGRSVNERSFRRSKMIDMNDKKQLILEAASELFSKVGYFETTMKDVAQKAGIAVGTIYIYYKNKEELLDGIYKFAASILLDRIKQKLEKASNPLEKFSLFINESIEFGFKYPYYFLIVFVDLRRKAIEFPKSVIYKFFQEYLAIGNEILEEGKKSGAFDLPGDYDVIFGATGFWGAYVLREILKPGAGKTSKKQKQIEIYTIFENTILNGLKTGRNPNK